MAAVTHPFVVLGVVATVAALGVGAVAWYQRASPGAREYTVIMVLLAAWSALYVMQLRQSTVSAKQPWLVARHALTPAIGLLFWLFAVRYTDRPSLLSRWYTAPLVAVGAAVTVLIIWNPGGVYVAELTPAVTASIPVVDIDFGPAFWLNVGYTLGLTAAGHFLIVAMFRESLDVYRPQLTAMTAAGTIEFVFATLFLSDHLTALPQLNPWPHIQLITYGMVFAVIPIGWSYVNGALFKLQPLAEQTVIENMDDAVFVFDRNDRLRYTNGSALELLEPSTDSELIGAPVETAFADRPELSAQYRRATDDAEVDSETLEFRVDGERRYYDLRSSTIDNAFGITTGVVVVAREVTAQTRQRAQLRERTEELETKTTQLEHRNEQLDQFSSFVSHDLRSPLQVASGYLRLARKTDNPDYLDEIAESLNRMDEMVADLRELTRVDQADLSTERVDLEPAARQAWGQIATTGARLSVVDGGEIVADREFLLHVFENLFRNSVEHGSTGSQTQSGDSMEHSSSDSQRDSRANDSAEYDSTSSRPNDDDTHADPELTVRVGLVADGLYIEDDGKGIPAEEREAVVKHGYSTANNGTGLGLSIVSTIAEAHGWELCVDESEDGGARFELTNADIETATDEPTEPVRNVTE